MGTIKDKLNLKKGGLMKNRWNLIGIFFLTVLTIVGCRHPDKGITPLPKPAVPQVPPPGVQGPTIPRPERRQEELPPGARLPTETGPTATETKPTEVPRTPSGIELAPPEMFEGMIMDTNYFKPQTVYFDFDSSFVKYSERPKAEVVAQVLKKLPEVKLLIDGHCDERGTEEYNRALGERRALALREYLIQLGIDHSRIRTRSWGEDRPVDPGHNEEAWAKNRRGEFILLLPPGMTVPPLEEVLKQSASGSIGKK